MTQDINYGLQSARGVFHPGINLDVGNNAVPAAHTAAVITLPADTKGRQWAISELFFGYSALPTGGALTISDGGTTKLGPIPVGDAAFHHVIIDPPLKGGTNAAVVITLADGGSGITGAVYANAYLVD